MLNHVNVLKLNFDTQNKTAQMATKVIKKLKAPATPFTVEYCGFNAGFKIL